MQVQRTDGEYVEQMVITDIPNSENQWELVKGITVSTDVAEHKQAGIQHNCSQKNKF